MSLLLFLRDLGMCWANAPGSAGKKNRFGGGTEPLVWAEFHLYKSVGGLYLQNAEVKEDFLAIRSDPKRLLAAIRFYKRTKQILIIGHAGNDILKILWNAMILLNKNCPVEIVEFRFNWRLLKALGLAPSLRNCCECGAALKNELSWSGDGLLCIRCRQTAAKPSPGILTSLQRAALLDQPSFVEWAKSQTQYSFFYEHTRKTIIFFTKFS